MIGFNKALNGVFIGYIQFVYVGVKPRVLCIFCLQQLHFVSQLAVAACNQDVHYAVILFIRLQKQVLQSCPFDNSRSAFPQRW